MPLILVSPYRKFLQQVNPIDPEILMLLHMNGEVNSSAFIDEAGNAISYYPTATPPKIVANGKFSTAVEFTVGTALIVTTDSDDFTIGTGDYTIEGFIHYDGSAPTSQSYHTLFTTSHPTDMNGFYVGITNGVISALEGAGSGWSTSEMKGGSVPLNQWVHIALSRKSGTSRLFMGGSLQKSWASPYNLPNPSKNIVLGARFTAGAWKQYYKGKMDEVRFMKQGIYTENFIPPSIEFDGTLS